MIVFSYQYVIDPKITELVTKEIQGNSILVFDEAHNIGTSVRIKISPHLDNVCIDALSINLTRQTLEASNRNLTKLTNQVAQYVLRDVVTDYLQE